MTVPALQVVKPEPRQKPVPSTGFAIVPASVLNTHDVACIAVYAALAQRANSERKSWPGVETIGATIGVSKPTVMKAIKKLAKAGLIVVSIREQHGSIRKHEYLLTGDSPVKEIDRQENINEGDHRESTFPGAGQSPLPVGDDDRSTSLTGTGKPPLPTPVNVVDRKKTNVNKTQENKTNTVTATAVTGQTPQPKKSEPKPKVKTQSESERQAFVLVDAYALGSGRATKDVVSRERYDARKAFEPLVDRFTADDIQGCTAYLKSDAFYKRGTLSPVNVAKAVGDWVEMGRPESMQPTKPSRQNASDVNSEFDRIMATRKRGNDDDGSVIEARARIG